MKNEKDKSEINSTVTGRILGNTPTMYIIDEIADIELSEMPGIHHIESELIEADYAEIERRYMHLFNVNLDLDTLGPWDFNTNHITSSGAETQMEIHPYKGYKIKPKKVLGKPLPHTKTLTKSSKSLKRLLKR